MLSSINAVGTRLTFRMALPQTWTRPAAKKPRTIVSYDRDPKVVAAVLLRARGICEACRSPSGFEGVNGEPFLEVHHVESLAEDGADRPWNAAGLCPDCHARCHYGKYGAAFNDSLYSKIPALLRSS